MSKSRSPLEPLLAGMFGALAAFACGGIFKIIVPGDYDGAGYGLIVFTVLAGLISWYFAKRRMGAWLSSFDDDIRLAGTSNPARLELMLQLLSITSERNTPEETAKLEAVKRLLARHK